MAPVGQAAPGAPDNADPLSLLPLSDEPNFSNWECATELTITPVNAPTFAVAPLPAINNPVSAD